MSTVVHVNGLEAGCTEVMFIARNSDVTIIGHLEEDASPGKALSLQLEDSLWKRTDLYTDSSQCGKIWQRSILLVAGGFGATYVLRTYGALCEAASSRENH